MYFAHKLAQQPAGNCSHRPDTYTQIHTQTLGHTHRHVVMSYDMLCRKSEQYLCLETRKKTVDKKYTHTYTRTHIRTCRMQNAVK